MAKKTKLTVDCLEQPKKSIFSNKLFCLGAATGIAAACAIAYMKRDSIKKLFGKGDDDWDDDDLFDDDFDDDLFEDDDADADSDESDSPERDIVLPADDADADSDADIEIDIEVEQAQDTPANGEPEDAVAADEADSEQAEEIEEQENA